MLAVALAACAAIGWGASDYFGGVSTNGTLVFSVVATSELIGSVLLLPAVVQAGAPGSNGRLLLAGVAGVAVTVELGVIFYALSEGAAFVTAPVGALGAAAAAATGLIGGDPLTPAIGIGLLCALAGGGAVALAGGSGGRGGRSPGLGPAIAACLLAAAAVATMQVALHAAGRVDPVWATWIEHLATAASATAAAVASVLRARRVGRRIAWRPGRRRLPVLAMLAATGTGGDLAFAGASSGALSTVSAIASLYPIPTIAMALVLQHRRPDRLQAAGIVLALAGATLLGASS